MNKLIIAPALLLLASNVIADNTISVDAALEAYVSTGLSASNPTILKFPDIVKPAAGQGNYSVTVDPSNGSVVYTGASAPGLSKGGDNLSQNATGSSTLLDRKRNYQIGVIEIAGEPGYSFSMTINVKDNEEGPAGMSYSSLIDTGDATGTAGSANLQLDTTGNLNVKYGGTLTVGEQTPSTNGLVNLTLNATISYR